MKPAGAWHIGGGRIVDLSAPVVMAILNITPDSFSDGGRLGTFDAALDRARLAIEAGAGVLDVGGESTRPGAERVEAAEQVRRVVPVVAALASRWPAAAISVDTTLAEVARAACDAGAAIVNDVSGGCDDGGMLSAVAELGVGYIAMHRERPPEADTYSDRYASPPITGDAVAHVRAALAGRLEAAVSAGIAAEAVVLDPGLGFGKTVEQNLDLIRRTGELLTLGRPIVSGASRKSFLGRVGLGRDSEPSEREGVSVAATLLHARAGARLFRVHDAAAHAQALRLLAALDGQTARFGGGLGAG